MRGYRINSGKQRDGVRNKTGTAPGKQTLTIPMQRAAAKPGKQTLTEALPAPVNTNATASATSSDARSGTPLPAAIQAKMEPAFGFDFSAVQIHQGGEAQAM